tara:strand:- start:698 stop:901 length:204 start_codon:yes stop_codon:yes gene_type:complete
MNNFSDKNVIIVILLTIFFVFALIFSVKSPERKVIEAPIIWKEEFSNISIIEYEQLNLNNYFLCMKI